MVGGQFVFTFVLVLGAMAAMGIAAGIFLAPLLAVMFVSSYVFNTAKFAGSTLPNATKFAVVLTIAGDFYAFFALNSIVWEQLHYLIASWPYFLHLSFGLHV